MNKIRINLLVFALFSLCLTTQNYNASEVVVEKAKQLSVENAPMHPTAAQVAAADPTDLVVFNDSKLEGAVAKKLSVSAGNITVADMSNLTTLRTDNLFFSDLTGMEYAVNLTDLNIISSNVSDLTPLANLTNLTSVRFYFSQISDLSPLANLTNLTSLNISEAKISDITPLVNLTNLEVLHLPYNQITDISTLSSFTKLVYLDIGYNTISDISAIANLTNLTDLIFMVNNITDVTPVANLTNLTNLDGSYNKITTLSGLENLTKLTAIYFTNNLINDISAVENLTQVDKIYLQENNISDISPIANLTKVEALQLINNKVEDISAVATLTNLKALWLTNNNVSDISPVSNLENLNTLWLSNNRISDISPLKPLISNSANNISLTMRNQELVLDDINVTNDDTITYNVIGLDGEEIPVTLGTPVFGAQNLTGNIQFQFGTVYQVYNANISQNVTYHDLTGLDASAVNEGSLLSDNQLIELFNIVSGSNQPITVDQSAVNYDDPGDYDVVFTNDVDTLTVTLTINDLAPTITLDQDLITIPLGTEINDYLTAFGVVATEITAGDLTASVIIDSSAVNLDLAGNYSVLFSVTDAEGTSVEKSGNVVVEDLKSPIIDQIPDVNSEVSSDVISDINSEVSSDVIADINSEVSSDVTSDDSSDVISDDSSDAISDDSSDVIADETNTNSNLQAMTSDKKYTLLSTGSLSTMMLFVLTSIIVLLSTIKMMAGNKQQ